VVLRIVDNATAKLRALGITATNPVLTNPEVVGSVEEAPEAPQLDPSVPVEEAPEAPQLDPSVPVVDPSRYIRIDRVRLRAGGFLPDVTQERRFADQYRRIKRPILMRVQTLSAARSPAARLILMASALPGDGKTFTSINLALSMARERDISVLIIDGDVAKPHISRIFGVDREPGLLDALADDSIDIESLVLPTDVDGMSMLPAGQYHESATELLASARMNEVLTRLTARDPRRIILLDSPPLLLSSESRALVEIAGQVVLVVRAGGTPRRAVQEAIGYVGEDKPLGLVLNQSQMALSEGYYGYGSYGDITAHAGAERG
jgi:exopolysaccharide/PEP-CTERM locus tyrosine autokinase